ncbi:Abi family protein [Psychrobacillus sp. NPDC096623]|uniref:Abi family protein n=1 Tax=Psychrobacillus sp. NPDC096623 TaxID=3364492 RepID=UPI0037FBB4C7
MSKIFKTHNQQLTILRKRNLDVPKTGTPKRILEKENYYNLINGYKELFIDIPSTSTTPEKYKTDTHISELKALYDFDFELRMILLKRIFRVENNIKSAIAYFFSQKYGHDNYLKLENFDLLISGTASEKNKVFRIKEIIDLIKGVQGEIAKNVTKHEAIKHYMSQHGYVPLWVLVNVLTFGTTGKFFKLMKQTDRQNVGRSFQINEADLNNIIGLLTLVRNKCAHDERLFDIITKTQIATNHIHRSLHIPLNSGGQPINGTHDLFAAIISLKLLSTKLEFKKMITEIKDAIEVLENQLNVISIDVVLDKMGFPSNWLDIRSI